MDDFTGVAGDFSRGIEREADFDGIAGGGVVILFEGVGVEERGEGGGDAEGVDEKGVRSIAVGEELHSLGEVGDSSAFEVPGFQAVESDDAFAAEVGHAEAGGFSGAGEFEHTVLNDGGGLPMVFEDFGTVAFAFECLSRLSGVFGGEGEFEIAEEGFGSEDRLAERIEGFGRSGGVRGRQESDEGEDCRE